MVLESTIVCIDNSEWMRNGDFLPTRIQAQQDAVSVICHSKTRQNPENNVALMTSASLEVLVTLTTDVGRVLSKLHHVQAKGAANFATGIKIAHLALKHRQGKNHRMRIVIFVGSPVEIIDKDLIKIAKKLKKEKVNVDIVLLGENTATSEKLSQFVETLNGKEGTGSHLVVVPPGPNLTEALRTSPIVQGEDGYTPAGGDFGSGFDVDPNLDPELALALRVSMEEQRQRQDTTGGKPEETPATTETGPTPATTTAVPDTGNAGDALLMNAMYPSGVDYNAMTEEEQIALAIQMSMNEANSTEPTTDEGTSETKTETPAATKTTEMETETEATAAEPMEEDQDYSAVMSDPAFLTHLVGSLPGVDPNSEAVQNALQALTGGQDDENSKETDDKKKEDKS